MGSVQGGQSGVFHIVQKGITKKVGVRVLDQRKVFEELAKYGIIFYTGVPDSYLNGFCNYALTHCPDRNIIAANEGNAVGIAAGHFFASREIPLVYMQNSGQGNAVNPLASLADPAVYAVPMILLIGWRGQGNSEPNHPQHKLQGEITPGLLELMHIPYSILTDSDADFAQDVKKAAEYCREHRRPYGLIAPKGVMADPEKRYALREAMENGMISQGRLIRYQSLLEEIRETWRGRYD